MKKLLIKFVFWLGGFLGLYVYLWPMSAVGAGTIYYQLTKEKNRLRVGISERSAKVGKGIGISSGGFVEIIEILLKPFNTVLNLLGDAWRENTEELPGVEKVISVADYDANAQPLVSIKVRKNDPNKVHCANYFGFEVTDKEREGLVALAPSDETTEPLKFVDMTWPEGEPEKATFSGI